MPFKAEMFTKKADTNTNEAQNSVKISSNYDLNESIYLFTEISTLKSAKRV
jgi:hypothetical protein